MNIFKLLKFERISSFLAKAYSKLRTAVIPSGTSLQSTWLKVLRVISRTGTYKTLKEYSALVTVVVLFFLSNTVLRWIDPTAGTYDAGVLQIINLSLVMMAVYQIAVWSIFKTLWPDLGIFMKHYFKETFLQLTPWEKSRLAVSVYGFLLLMLVLLSRVVQ